MTAANEHDHVHMTSGDITGAPRTTSTDNTLSARDILYRIGAHTVLAGASLTVGPGSRVAVIGENGSGKSTLLRLLAGAVTPERGTVSRPASLGFLEQEERQLREGTVGELSSRAMHAALRLERELESAALRLADGGEQAIAEYERVLGAAERAEIWSASARWAQAVAAFGLEGLAEDRPLASLSGGH